MVGVARRSPKDRLKQKRDAETLTPEEHAELIQLVQDSPHQR